MRQEERDGMFASLTPWDMETGRLGIEHCHCEECKGRRGNLLINGKLLRVLRPFGLTANVQGSFFTNDLLFTDI